MIKMFRDRSRIRKVVIVEDGAAMLPKMLVEIRRGPRDLDDRPPPPTLTKRSGSATGDGALSPQCACPIPGKTGLC